MSSLSRRAHSATRAPPYSSTATGLVTGAAAGVRAFDGALLGGGERVRFARSGMRARLTAMRSPACSYISVTAARAWSGSKRAKPDHATEPGGMPQCISERTAGDH
ncbi:hypothetical protein [Streptosporangium sp. NPDC087985]|uniref:hypothetical protein n=1 Tax=Streptosporangium sp. NPDC087985 TaxID=3366196 RepID=UPI0037FD4A76